MSAKKRIAFFDSKPYDKEFFGKYKDQYDLDITFFDGKLNPENAKLAAGYDGAVAFVNCNISAEAIDVLVEGGVKVLGMRCAGFDAVDLKHAKGKLRVFRVPAYSPNAVAEHAMSLLMCLNRKLHRAYNRVRDFDFRISGFTGMDLTGKTVGVIGTGKIGQVFIRICNGLGMNVIAFDPYPVNEELRKELKITYVSLDELFTQADVISLHSPLTPETRHIIKKENIDQMKDGVIIINAGRGGLVDGAALLEGIKSGKVGAAGIDVYENEQPFFYEDRSGEVIDDEVLVGLLSYPNVLVTAHQAFLTEEALFAISNVTLGNLSNFFNGVESPDTEVVYQG